jgi:NDP-sugar pyrophosphorylase family protein
MRAFILAAGLGTRLRPLTDKTPKALVPFRGMPLLERIIRNIADSGIQEIMVNVHHFSAQVIDFLETLDVQGVSISVSDETGRLMNTGGALLQARGYLGETENFLVHNVDVITNLDIPALMRQHDADDALATIAVKKRNTSRSLLFDSDSCLAGWRQNETGEEKIVRTYTGELDDYGNSCVQVIHRDFFSFFPDPEPLNLTEMYLELAGDKLIRSFNHSSDYWYDLGRYQNFREAEKQIF